MVLGAAPRRALVATALGVISCSAYSVQLTVSGDVAFNTDIVEIPFHLNDASNDLKVWTDSYQSGVNFDPVSAVWKLVGGQYVLLGQNDDNPHLAAGQTLGDSGMHLQQQGSGDYLYTIGAYPNFAYGTLLSQQFDLQVAGAASQPLGTWCQPGGLCSVGSFWRANIESAGLPVLAVPEPATTMLFAAGVLAFAFRRGRKANPAA